MLHTVFSLTFSVLCCRDGLVVKESLLLLFLKAQAHIATPTSDGSLSPAFPAIEYPVPSLASAIPQMCAHNAHK